MKVGNAVLNIFFIGAVCTDVDYRNRGISSAILKEIYTYIDQAEASLLFISGTRGLYRRNNCHPFGKVHVESSIWEWTMLLDAGGYTSVFKMKQALYVATTDGALDGYVVIGLPTEASTYEQGIVTDWGGNPKAVYAILMDLLKTSTIEKIEINIPWQDKLNDECKGYTSDTKKNGGTINIVNAKRLLDQLMPYLKEKELAQNLEVVQQNDDGVLLKYGEFEKAFSNEELVDLIFGNGQVDRSFEQLFPVPLPSTEGFFYV
ncbi:GNAT family N-acetyltransferase [Oceanobacillus longus]|uniref:GNAT family N-acetyltransferase n=1 Tax=Oceanobacillus longus TaxID=930120 RepID=A0ABV8GYV2_9BACI